MRVGLISDIHGNAPALEAVLLDAKTVGPVDRWLCAGDFVGHLPLVNEVFALVQRIDPDAVRGNHDQALLDGSEIARSGSATLALEVQRGFVGDDLCRYLAQLPVRRDLEIEGQDIVLVHGGPRDALEEYLYDPGSEAAALAGNVIVVHGHTHIPLYRVVDRTVFVNPGSVGMPLDGDPRAAWALWDTRSGAFDLRRVAYNEAPIVARLQELGFDDRYANCLAHGRWVGPSGPQ